MIDDFYRIIKYLYNDEDNKNKIIKIESIN